MGWRNCSSRLEGVRRTRGRRKKGKGNQGNQEKEIKEIHKLKKKKGGEGKAKHREICSECCLKAEFSIDLCWICLLGRSEGRNVPFPAFQSSGSILGEQIHGDEVRQGRKVLWEELRSSCSCFFGKKRWKLVFKTQLLVAWRVHVPIHAAHSDLLAFSKLLERVGSWERAVPGHLCPALVPI